MIYYVIHMFRMSAFFLIAGFFACMVVERRGVTMSAPGMRRARRCDVGGRSRPPSPCRGAVQWL